MYQYSKSEIKKEQEANYFALCLLMPRDMFLAEWKKLKDQNIDEEKQCFMLADIFKVPVTACALRMADLGECFLTNTL